MIKKVAFTMYPVADIKRARQFYEDTLGLAVGNIYSHGEKGEWVEYDLPQGGCFAITTLAKNVQPSASAGGSIAFEVEDLKQVAEKLKAAGVKFLIDIFASPVCQMAVIQDTEGNALSLHQVNRK